MIKIVITVLAPVNVSYTKYVMCVRVFLEWTSICNRPTCSVKIVLVVLTLPVRYCALLNWDSFIHVDIVSLFVINVWHPRFSLNEIIIGSTWLEKSMIYCFRTSTTCTPLVLNILVTHHCLFAAEPLFPDTQGVMPKLSQKGEVLGEQFIYTKVWRIHFTHTHTHTHKPKMFCPAGKKD